MKLVRIWFRPCWTLLANPRSLSVSADREVTLPGGAQVYRRWRMHATVGRAAVDININLGPGFGQRTISVRGHNGSAVVDFDANTCLVDRRTALSFDLDRYSRSRSLARQIRSQARATLADYLLSTIRLRQRGGPYQATFFDSVRSFYASLVTNGALNSRIDGGTGRNVIEWCDRIIQAAGVPAVNPSHPPRPRAIVSQPTVLVFGGTGFIGRELIRQLLAANYYVRAVIHRSGSVLEEIDSDHLEIVRGDMGSKMDLKRLITGIEFVFHLARAHVQTWEDYLHHDVEPTRLIAEACLKSGVRQLIYPGTIASYYTGAHAGTITEQTPLDRAIARRDYYSRAKAAAESILMEMYRTKQLPVVIFRPGIVNLANMAPRSIGESGGGFPKACARYGVMAGISFLSYLLVTSPQRWCEACRSLGLRVGPITWSICPSLLPEIIWRSCSVIRA